MMKKEEKKVIISIIGLIAFQSFLYMIAKLTPFNYHVVNIDFDNHIPFIKYFVYPYIIWYITLFLVPYIFYKKDKKFYKIYIKTILISLSITFIIYIFFPTTLVREQIVVKDLSTFIIDLIYKIDTPAINCLPSAHCILSFVHIYITLMIKGLNKKAKGLIIVQSLLVIMSTVFIKQHVILDVITAFLLSLIVYLIVYFYAKKKSKFS